MWVEVLIYSNKATSLCAPFAVFQSNNYAGIRE